MANRVMVQIPVSPEAAAALADADRRAKVGKLVSVMVQPSSPDEDPLAAVIAERKSDARAGKLTDREIDAELAAENSKRRL